MFRLLIMMVVVTTCGCNLTRSRYAMNDPLYAEKYYSGASKGDLLGKLKQALDARHTQYLEGWLGSFGAQVRPSSGQTFGSFEFGKELYRENYFSNRLSFAGFAGDESASVGVDVGARLQSPTRIAPFVGVGGYAGILVQDAIPLAVDIAIDSSTIDDSNNHSVDGIATFYPEVGLHIWLDGKIRISTFGRYLVTTEGRDFDDWLIGGQITLFGR